MPPPMLVPPAAVPPVMATPPVAAPPVAAGPRPVPVPVPPIAVGVLAFLLVLLWESDSIESGADERRKLEGERRRGPQTPNPPPVGVAPEPAPVPTPAPPLGTAAHERRLPNQTCENHILDTLQKAMHNVCDRIPGESCSPKKVSPKKLARRPCSQIRQRIEAVRQCLRLRQGIQDQCFRGVPDETHARALLDVQSGLTACLALEAVNCAPGHPMAEL